MSKHDHAEQLAQYEAARREMDELANIIDYYTPLRPATFSPKAEVVTAQLTQETKPCNAATR